MQLLSSHNADSCGVQSHSEYSYVVCSWCVCVCGTCVGVALAVATAIDASSDAYSLAVATLVAGWWRVQP
jgi:hypothetical protein